ncbi:MAG: zinc ribbon domain-containing protein [Desulfonatronovibrio sp. MSAO_Bac4]|nr:MAG: zinc ribbon domain-containing protein [Desulfonatronovibrio sp. MSAO_Bac4]
MPIFEYYCSKCKEIFEEITTNSQEKDVFCPKCGKDKHVQKCMSAAAIGKSSYKSSGSSPGAACSPGGFS